MSTAFLKGNMVVLVKTWKKGYPLAMSQYLLKLFIIVLFNVMGKCSCLKLKNKPQNSVYSMITLHL